MADYGASAGGGGGQGGQRSPLVFPSSVTRGPGPIECIQPTIAPNKTPILRANGLPNEGQVWMLSVQATSTLGLVGTTPGCVVDCFRDDHVIIGYAVGNTWQLIEADIPAGGIAVPLLAEQIEVSIMRANIAGPFPRPSAFFAACINAALGSPRSAKLTRTIEATTAEVAAGTGKRIPPKATEVQFSFDVFAVPATATILIDFVDSAGQKVGATGFQNNVGSIRYTLPRAAVRWNATGPALGPVVAVFEINP